MTRTAVRLLIVLSALGLVTCASRDKITPPTPGDTEPPTVTSVQPAEGASDLRLLQSFAINFSEAMNPATLNAQTVRLGPPDVALDLSLAPSGTTLTLFPDSLLPAGVALTLTVNGATDLAGNTLAAFALHVQTGPMDCEHLADRFEPNQDAAQATTISIDTLYKNLSTCLDDEDFFRFTVTDTLKVTAKTSMVYAPSVGWLINWIRNDGTTYAATLGTGANTGEVKQFHYSFLPGTYCLQLACDSDEERVLYDLELETSPPCRDDQYEDNDFEDEAVPIAAGQHADLVACYLDPDWYSVPVLAGQTITLTMDTGAYEDLRRLTIHEPGGQTISRTRELGVPVSTLSLAITADGEARFMCMVWGEGIAYDMTVAVE